MRILSFLRLLQVPGCCCIPEGILPVDGFRLDRYLGIWFEIARLEHSFERGLTRVTAEYRLRGDGGVSVTNRGWSSSQNRWKEAVGRAYPVKGPDQGYFRVSFFGPFYGAYIVIDLDHEDYQHALVCGPDRSYLWLLARTPEMRVDVRDAVVAKAAALGFETNKLFYVRHD
jgi:apolipoprotein D and lipocalin family protein